MCDVWDQEIVFPFSPIQATARSGDSFKYLSHYFNVEMDNEVHKEKLKSSLSDMLTRIDVLPVLP